jgi:hypothetical protein
MTRVNWPIATTPIESGSTLVGPVPGDSDPQTVGGGLPAAPAPIPS